jgi:hypothetical protein
MKQTAVEWLFEQYVNKSIITLEDIEQAKAMEKEQRKKDFVNGYKARAKESNLIFDEKSEYHAKKLFNKTFKSE